MRLTVLGSADAFTSAGRGHSCYWLDGAASRPVVVDFGGTALAAASYVTIRGLWRWHLVCEVKKRRALRRARAGLSASRSEPETPS